MVVYLGTDGEESDAGCGIAQARAIVSSHRAKVGL